MKFMEFKHLIGSIYDQAIRLDDARLKFLQNLPIDIEEFNPTFASSYQDEMLPFTREVLGSLESLGQQIGFLIKDEDLFQVVRVQIPDLDGYRALRNEIEHYNDFQYDIERAFFISAACAGMLIRTTSMYGKEMSHEVLPTNVFVGNIDYYYFHFIHEPWKFPKVLKLLDEENLIESFNKENGIEEEQEKKENYNQKYKNRSSFKETRNLKRRRR